MKNKWFRYSWYNFKNVPEDDFDKAYNDAYQENKGKYFKKILHMYFGYDMGYRLEYVNMWNATHIIWETPNTRYWMIIRSSDSYKEKGKFHLEFKKTDNDHTYCAG